MSCGLERDVLDCWRVMTKGRLNVRAGGCDSPLPWTFCKAMGERKLFFQTRMARCNLLAGAARELHAPKGPSPKP